jgi:hypothetical protein
MRIFGQTRSVLLSAGAALALAACTQGETISSPGASNPGTPPGGGGGAGGGGGSGSGVCPAGFATGAPVGGLTTCNITGTILSNLSLPAVSGVAYRLNGRVDVGVDIGADGNQAGGARATLTIEPGAIVFGSSGADYLVVNRGSQLLADGTAASPIIFTSANDLNRQADSDPNNNLGGSLTAEWGGIVILGRAPINRCNTGGATAGTSACQNAVEGVTNPDALYGGAIANDRSGKLEYVQVRFAGFAINSAGNELNGITLAGVGSETEVGFVQVHNNEDDGIELFGGTVNLRNIVLTGNKDDSFDTDNGWNGNLQFLIAVQAADIGDNIVEASSVAPNVGPPFSDARVANFTFVGNRSNAFRLNTGTRGQYVNGVVDYGTQCFRWETTAGDGVSGFNASFDPRFNSVLFDCNSGLTTSNSDTPTATASVGADPNSVQGPSSLAARLFPGPNEAAVTPFNVTTLGSFFTAAPYVGAFGPAETETSNWAAGWTFALFPPTACPAGTIDTGGSINGVRVCSFSGVITSDVRLTRGNLYRINGRIDVGVDIGADGTAVGGDPASLTIESGVTVFGNSGADYIVVNRGSQIFSNGTSANPVIMTSLPDVTDPNRNDNDNTAEWGGLVVLGRAPINRCNTGGATAGTAACQNAVEGVTNPDALYGGALANDDSGSIRFTQVRFAGFAINSAGNELNGITLAGVGAATEVSNVQVHNNEDDGIEIFGGAVNLRNVVLTGNKDDSLDTDNGWNGSLQFLIVVQNPVIGDNIVEASSVAPNVGPPFSDARVSNFTFVGNRSNAWRLNTGTRGQYVNGVVTYGQPCFRWETTAGDGIAGFNAATDPRFNSVLFDCVGGLTPSSGSDSAAAAGSVGADANNSTATADTLISTFVNGANETARTPFDVTTLGAFFTPVTYIGAVRDASDRWWAGWTCGLEASSDC